MGVLTIEEQGERGKTKYTENQMDYSAAGVFKHLGVTAGLNIVHQPKQIVSCGQRPLGSVLWQCPVTIRIANTTSDKLPSLTFPAQS